MQKRTLLAGKSEVVQTEGVTLGEYNRVCDHFCVGQPLAWIMLWAQVLQIRMI